VNSRGAAPRRKIMEKNNERMNRELKEKRDNKSGLTSGGSKRDKEPLPITYWW